MESHLGPSTIVLAVAAGDTYIGVGITGPDGYEERDVVNVWHGGGLTALEMAGPQTDYLYAWNGLRLQA